MATSEPLPRHSLACHARALCDSNSSYFWSGGVLGDGSGLASWTIGELGGIPITMGHANDVCGLSWEKIGMTRYIRIELCT